MASRPVPERVQEALALVAAGSTFREAAEHAGMRTQSLWERWQRLLGPDSPEAAVNRKRADEALAAGAHAGALRAMELMLADLEDGTAPPDERRAHLLAFSRVLGRLDPKHGGDTGSRFADALASAVERIERSGGSVALAVKLEAPVTTETAEAQDLSVCAEAPATVAVLPPKRPK